MKLTRVYMFLSNLVNYRFIVVLVYVATLLTSISYINSGLRTEPPNIKSALDEFKKNSSLRESESFDLRIVVASPKGLSLESFMKDCERINNYIKASKKVENILSPYNIEFGNEIEGLGYVYDYFLGNDTKWSEVSLEEKEEILRKRPDSPLKYLLSKDLKWVSWLIASRLDLSNAEEYRIFGLDLEKVVTDGGLIPKTHLFLGGVTGRTIAKDKVLNEERVLVFSMAALISTLLIFVLTRSLRAGMIAVMVVVAGSIISLVVPVYLNLPIGPMSQFSPCYIGAILLADSLYINHNFRVLNEPNQSQRNLTEKVLRSCLRPCLFTSLTAVLGFLAMTFSSMDAIWLVGVMSAFGIMMGFFLMILLYSSFGCLSYRDSIGEESGEYIKAVFDFLFRNKKLILIIYLFVLIPMALYQMSEFKYSTNLWHTFKGGMEKNGLSNKGYEGLRSYRPVEVVIKSKNAIKKAQIRAALIKFKKGFEGKAIYSGLESFDIETLIKDYWLSHGADYKGEEAKRESAIYDLPEDYVDSVYKDEKTFVFQLNMSESHLREGSGADELFGTIKKDLSLIVKGDLGEPTKVVLSSPEGYIVRDNKEDCRNIFMGMMTSSFVILSLFYLFFRSPSIVLIVFLSNMTAALLPIVVMGVFMDGMIYPVAMALCMIIAVCSDDTMHIVAVHQRKKSQGSKTPAKDAILLCAAPTVQTTMVVLIGVAVIASISSFQINTILFYTVVLGLLCALIVDLVITPLALDYMDSNDKKRNNK